MTKQKQRILWCLAKGMGNKGIAKLLGIELRTVKNHVFDLCTHYKVRNRIGVVIAALKQGDITLADLELSDDCKR